MHSLSHQILLSVALFFLWGCGTQAPPQRAQGTATVDELLQAYLDAHQSRDMTPLHDVLLWRASTGGVIRGWQLREQEIEALFDLQLDQIVLVEFAQSDNVEGINITYEWPNPRVPGGISTVYIAGPFIGKIVLRGTAVDQNGTVISLEVDPALTIRPHQGRYYIFGPTPILGWAAEAVQEGRPTVHTPQPFPDQVETVWWSADDATP